jgi:hypothetical protein
MTGQTTDRGIGLAVTAPEETIRAACRATGEAGYHSFWLNNPPRTDALAVFGGLTPDPALWLGVGVIPLANFTPEEVVERVREHILAPERFYLGIGSGAGGVQGVADGIRVLRRELNSNLVVAALGPRMCRLGGVEADGVLLNWLTPEHARTSAEWIRSAAREAGRPPPRIMAYIRVALGAGAIERLRQEASRYESVDHYATHFRRMGVPAFDTAIAAQTPDDLRQGLAAWDGIVDEVVYRLITATDSPAEVESLIRSASDRT